MQGLVCDACARKEMILRVTHTEAEDLIEGRLLFLPKEIIQGSAN